MSKLSKLTKYQSELLAVIRATPGLLWYETGEKAWPHKTVTRVNIFFLPFRELTGHGAYLTGRTLDALKAKGLVEKRGFSYYATETAAHGAGEE